MRWAAIRDALEPPFLARRRRAHDRAMIQRMRAELEQAPLRLNGHVLTRHKLGAPGERVDCSRCRSGWVAPDGDLGGPARDACPPEQRRSCSSEGCSRPATAAIRLAGHAGHVHDCTDHAAQLREQCEVVYEALMPGNQCPWPCTVEPIATETPMQGSRYLGYGGPV